MSEHLNGDAVSQARSLTFDHNLNPQDESSRLTPNESAPLFPGNSDEKVAPDITAYFSHQESPSTFDLITATQAVKLDDNAPRDIPFHDSFAAVTSISSTVETANDASSTDRLFLCSDSFIYEEDQCHAWIPSERTRQYLTAMKSASDPTEFPGEDRVTTPRILMVENLGDPILDVVARIFGEEGARGRKSLTVDDVDMDFDGLRKLIASGNHRSAVDLTRILLERASAHHEDDDLGSVTPVNPTTLQLWTTRLTLMMFKLHLYPAVEAELSAFEDLDQPDTYFEFHPTGDFPPHARGSMVPFALRLLWAELPAHSGKPTETLDRLYQLLTVVDLMIGNLMSGISADGSSFLPPPATLAAALLLWRHRRLTLLYSIANVLLITKDIDSAVITWERIADEEAGDLRKAAVYSSTGRILLQVGDVVSAEEYFSRAEAVLIDVDSVEARVMKLTHLGYLAIGGGNFGVAFTHFQQALSLKPGDAIVANNAATSLVYLGRLEEAVSILWSLVESDPSRHLHEGVCFNLATLFELEMSRFEIKKKELLKLVAEYRGDGFSPLSLKMG